MLGIGSGEADAALPPQHALGTESRRRIQVAARAPCRPRNKFLTARYTSPACDACRSVLRACVTIDSSSAIGRSESSYSSRLRKCFVSAVGACRVGSCSRSAIPNQRGSRAARLFRCSGCPKHQIASQVLVQLLGLGRGLDQPLLEALGHLRKHRPVELPCVSIARRVAERIALEEPPPHRPGRPACVPVRRIDHRAHGIESRQRRVERGIGRNRWHLAQPGNIGRHRVNVGAVAAVADRPENDARHGDTIAMRRVEIRPAPPPSALRSGDSRRRALTRPAGRPSATAR